MLFLAKLAGVAVLAWFYLTAQQHKEPPVKWAVIGLIGYSLAWLLLYQLIVAMIPAALTRTTLMAFVVMQIPAICALVGAYFIRKKLVHDVNNQKLTQSEQE